MSANGILNGVGDNMFAPQNNTQKQQVLAIAVRMYENIINK
ncbi:MAG: S-layer homology domain-containing protein [Ruminococcaceae bacterium]|nr:S-layer homology domain-containing protein [Oscillospiraceae bacterium]